LGSFVASAAAAGFVVEAEEFVDRGVADLCAVVAPLPMEAFEGAVLGLTSGPTIVGARVFGVAVVG
jgi:hypothetical protein